MQILFMGNGWVGWQVIRFLKEKKEKIAGVVLNPVEKRRYADEIIETYRHGSCSLPCLSPQPILPSGPPGDSATRKA